VIDSPVKDGDMDNKFIEIFAFRPRKPNNGTQSVLVDDDNNLAVSIELPPDMVIECPI
jgi:hypothetical protein